VTDFFGQIKAEVKQAAGDVWAGTIDLGEYRDRLTAKFGQFDPRWAQCALKYADYFVLRRGTVPYRRHQQLNDFDITGKLPAKARVALIADWGTGLDAAFRVLGQVAAAKPDVVIHLGDIYYTGTDDEVRRAFLDPVQQILRPACPNCTVLSLAGNHDMYSGGHGYYGLLDQLGQPASYFCLANADWQFLAIDTGLNGRFMPDRPTFLEDTELAWLQAKVAGAGGRRNVLLSHHQLFAAYESVGDGAFNPELRRQLEPLLPQVPLWFWGHEHNFVVYESYHGCLARCIGHAAIPVDFLPMTPKFTDVPVVVTALGHTGGFYNHGYALMDLDGPQAHVAYYQDSNPAAPIWEEFV
jgi:hypothetical protein